MFATQRATLPTGRVSPGDRSIVLAGPESYHSEATLGHRANRPINANFSQMEGVYFSGSAVRPEPVP